MPQQILRKILRRTTPTFSNIKSTFLRSHTHQKRYAFGRTQTIFSEIYFITITNSLESIFQNNIIKCMIPGQIEYD